MRKQLSLIGQAAGETYKHTAQAELAATRNPAELLKWIESHFFRSLEAWLRGGGGRQRRTVPRHGTFSEYIGAWLRANGDTVNERKAEEALAAMFPPPLWCRGIGRGYSYWGLEQDWPN